VTRIPYIADNKALNFGCNYYDTKPVVFKRLLETTGTLIRGRSVS
jgi:hypothetical protein